MQHTDWHKRRTRGERPAASTCEAVTTVVRSVGSGAAWAAIQAPPSTSVHPGRALHLSARQSPHLQNSDNDTIKLLNLVLGWNKYLNQEPLKPGAGTLQEVNSKLLLLRLRLLLFLWLFFKLKFEMRSWWKDPLVLRVYELAATEGF